MYRIIGAGQGARLEKKDEDSYNGYREVAKIIVDNEEETRETINYLRELIDRDRKIRNMVSENEELMKKLEWYGGVV